MRSILTSTLLVSFCACQSYVAVPVQPVTLVAVSQHNLVRVFTKADVLLVVDDSLSMSGKQERLAAALAGFTQQLDQLVPPVDYQVAVTTTTVSERLGACGPAGDPSAAAECDSEWQATGFASDEGFACFRAFPQAGLFHQGPAAPAAVLRRDDTTAAQFAAALASSVQVGVGGSRQPQGLEAMKLALQQPHFLRDGSKIVVAFFTDAEDCSDPAHRLSMLTKDPATGNVVDQCAIMSRGGAPSALEPVANYVNYLRSLKDTDGTPKEVEVGAIVSLHDGTQDPGFCANPACDSACDAPAGVAACNARCQDSPTYQICMADCASECHTFCGGQLPGRRYLDLAFSFSGVAANVCSDDASPALSQLSAVIGIPKQVLLRAQPSSPDLL
ncbi:MAG TPA: hypothetical protein VMK66_03840, partial [Myxococcales bacterium]|nr:hypothetical protein [Myxococcales bacterium]